MDFDRHYNGYCALLQWYILATLNCMLHKTIYFLFIYFRFPFNNTLRYWVHKHCLFCKVYFQCFIHFDIIAKSFLFYDVLLYLSFSGIEKRRGNRGSWASECTNRQTDREGKGSNLWLYILFSSLCYEEKRKFWKLYIGEGIIIAWLCELYLLLHRIMNTHQI